MCLEGGADGDDDSIGYLVRAAGVRLACTQLGAPAHCHGNAKLVGDFAAARLARRVGLARRTPTLTLLSP